MFTTVSLKIAKQWTELKFPSTGERLNNLWPIHTWNTTLQSKGV